MVLRGVRRDWGDRTVIRDIGMTVHRGDIAWIGGANGAGKTTLMRVAAGVIEPHAGTVSLLGLDPERDRREYQRRLGWLPAGNSALYNRLTVRQNLAYWASISLIPSTARSTRITESLAEFDLEKFAGRRADRISMGERQRLRLAMAFLHGPELVLLDEPDTSLDDDGLARLRAAVDRLTSKGGAAVWCSPNREGTDLPATVEYLVQDGKLVAC